MQLVEHRQIGFPGCHREILIRQIGNRNKTDMGALAIEGAAGQWLVAILEPVGADKIGVVGNAAQITGIGGPTFAFPADADKPVPKHAPIDRSEVELADQGRLTEPVKTRPFVGIIGDRPHIAIETDDVAPPSAGLDCLAGLRVKTASEIEVVRIVAVQRFGHRAKIGVGKPPGEGCQIGDHRGIAEGLWRQCKPGVAQRLPRGQRDAPGLRQPFRLSIGLDQIRSKGRP